MMINGGCETLTSSFFIQYFIFSANNELPKTSGFGDPESKAAQRKGSHTRDNASDKGVFIVVQTPASACFVDPLFWEYNMYIFLRWKTQSEGVFFLGRGYPWHSCSCAAGRVHGASIGSVFPFCTRTLSMHTTCCAAFAVPWIIVRVKYLEYQRCSLESALLTASCVFLPLWPLLWMQAQYREFFHDIRNLVRYQIRKVMNMEINTHLFGDSTVDVDTTIHSGEKKKKVAWLAYWG